ncbi:MAG: beta galactosidase jelly roll domain-containing protein [Ignavibacteriaceae bacterium]
MKLFYITGLSGFLLSLLILGACVEYHNEPKKKQKDDKIIIDLSGNWKFNLGDDLDWKDKNFEDNKWESVKVPSSWENQGFPGYNGYAWYRKSFKLNPEISNKDLFLVLGYVDDVDQTFINGNLIGVSGGFPPDYRTAYNAFRKYYIPKEFLNNNGDNEIAVRVYDSELNGGILSGDIGIYTYEKGVEPDINLSGLWNFSTGDKAKWSEKNFDDSDWKKLMVPAHWEIQGFSDYDGFAWYRKEFFLPNNYSGESLILLLGQIDDIDQTFVNGTQIGSTGLWNFVGIPKSFNDHEEWQQKRIYSVPQKLLNFGGTNTISVRVYDGFGEGGIYEGPIGLITQSSYRKYFVNK